MWPLIQIALGAILYHETALTRRTNMKSLYPSNSHICPLTKFLNAAVLGATLFALTAPAAYGSSLTPITFNLPSGDQLYSVAFDASGNLWATGNLNGQNAVVKINTSNGAITNTYTTSGFSTTNLGFSQTVIDASGNLYQGCAYGCGKLWEFNTITDAFTSYSSIGGSSLYAGGISIDSSGNFLLANGGDILNFSSPSGTPTVYGFSNDAATLNSGGNLLTDAVVSGSSLIYSIETYGGGNELGILNPNSPGNNIEYSPLRSITGGGTLSNADSTLATDSVGNVYTIDPGNPFSTLYELNIVSDTWTAVGTLPRSNFAPSFQFDHAGNLWSVGAGTLEEFTTGAPEPSTWLLLATGLGIAALWQKHSRTFPKSC